MSPHRNETVETLARRIVERLAKSGLTLTTAESCTGGALACTFATIPGSGEIFQGGFVCYSKRAKERALGVSPVVLGKDTAVSRRVAEMMARGARERMDCDLAVAITGVIGPEADEDGNPVGLVHSAVAARAGNMDHLEQRLEGLAPETLRDEAILGALRLLAAALDRRSLVPRADEGG
ncbi:competence damage-inducible protein A [Hyphomicrobium nitrativorans NL23]|uniref:Competence damage-inducible protein A n=1 Tax=Hyphomicrobium nitrativorans NL23 TaxID=1029756 RepID=V5SGH5_9HYPH|nr:CinA family protein [Hyphomicrobium nitrativorans]AHB49602.1 competence damage-inducible protein A [Hyphomicrobium nitrativorans NL23]